jgi:predicted transcriptional regulator
MRLQTNPKGPEFSEYLERDPRRIGKITQGTAAADRGKLFDHDQVMQEMEIRPNRPKERLK